MRACGHLQRKDVERVLGAAHVERSRVGIGRLHPDALTRFQPRVVTRRALRQTVGDGALHVAVLIEDGGLALVLEERRVGGIAVEEIAIDVSRGVGAGIGRIDYVDAAQTDGGAEDHDVEVVVEQQAPHAADLQHFACFAGALLVELRQADAETADGGVGELVLDGDHGGHMPA